MCFYIGATAKALRDSAAGMACNGRGFGMLCLPVIG